MITIGLIDDNPTLLRNISQNLSIFDEIEILFRANGGYDALDKLNNHKPDILLMDIEMPDLDGIETTRKVKERFPEIKIMMLSVLDRENKIFDAIKAGASGYLKELSFRPYSQKSSCVRVTGVPSSAGEASLPSLEYRSGSAAPPMAASVGIMSTACRTVASSTFPAGT